MKTLYILTTLLICGCASVGRKLDESKIDQIQKGVTTRSQVLQLIGSPEQIIRNGDGQVTFRYFYARATTKATTFIPVAGAFVGGTRMQNQSLIIMFRPDGVVSDLISSYGGNELNSGLNTSSKAKLDDVETNKRPK